MSRTDDARLVVCRELMATQLGERLPTTAQLAAEAGVGYGTIATVLRMLSDDGLVQLSTHGHQGTRLHARNTRALWQAAGRGPLVGVLPLPHSAEFMGLATAFTQVAEEHGIGIHLLFRQGSDERFQALRSGRVDWIVTSQEAAIAQHGAYRHSVLGDYSYYGRDAVVVITRVGSTPDARGRVPIDRSSHDHAALTTAEFPGAAYVDASYVAIPEMIVSGEVDAAVWHHTSVSPLLTATGLGVHPLTRPSPAGRSELFRAALVWRREDRAVTTLLSEIFSADGVSAHQLEVIKGDAPPRF